MNAPSLNNSVFKKIKRAIRGILIYQFTIKKYSKSTHAQIIVIPSYNKNFLKIINKYLGIFKMRWGYENIVLILNNGFKNEEELNDIRNCKIRYASATICLNLLSTYQLFPFCENMLFLCQKELNGRSFLDSLPLEDNIVKLLLCLEPQEAQWAFKED